MKNTTLDLSQCDLEPVRFINAIQEFAAILVTDEKSKIKCVSENYFSYTGLPVMELLEKEISDKYFPKDNFHISQTKSGLLNVFQVERKSPDSSPSLNDFLDQLEKSSTLKELLDNTATSIAELSNFDRVMIYKFHDDFHGEVVAEKTKQNVESFFGLHYPASDIPKPARAIFLETWLRMIPDVSYTPVALTTTLKENIDLGQVLVRAVSPIHIQYLKNMNVGATLTISIIVDEKLWGLIACHNSTSQFLTKELRDKCESIGRFASSLVNVVSLKEKNRHSDIVRVIHQKVGARLAQSDDMGRELVDHSPTLLDLIDAQGASAALYIDGHWVNMGVTPSVLQLDQLVDWLVANHSDVPCFETNELSQHYPASKEYKDICSGLLAVNVPKTSRNYILWFRPEIVQTVIWAGNPDKDLISDNGRLSPRNSFEEWKSTVAGKSLPWKSWEIEAAVELRNIILAVDLKKQFSKEQIARAEAERAKNAREELMAVVSHDLKNPLNSIQMNTQLLRRHVASADTKSSMLVERVLRSATTMNNLINDILSIAKLESGQFEIVKFMQPLFPVVSECVEMLSPLAHEKGISLSIKEGHLECELEYDYDRLLQVLSNLIGNAIKFTPEKGKIVIEIDRCGPTFARIKVTDTGPGIPQDNLKDVFDRFWQANQAKRLGTGLGLSIAKGLVEAHEGEIWVESKPGEGSTFQFTLPLS